MKALLRISVGDVQDFGHLKPKWAEWLYDNFARIGIDTSTYVGLVVMLPFWAVGLLLARCAMEAGLLQWKARIRRARRQSMQAA